MFDSLRTFTEISIQVAQLALNEVDRLVAEMVRLRRENLELRGATPEQLQQELALLDQRLAADAARLEAEFDKRTTATKNDGDEEQDEAEQATKKKPRTRSGSRLEQRTLPVVEVIHDVDEADRKCRECGFDTKLWEGQDDVTEEVDVVTREFVIRKHLRRKYRCTCGCLESADMPKRLVPGGRYSNELAVEVATMKYVDQLPLERIVKIFKREGLVIDSQTLWDQVHALANILKPTYRRLRDEILTSPVIGMDQSPWKVLGHDKTWQMWTLTTTKLCWFDICETKGTADGIRVLGPFKGTVIDGAATTHSRRHCRSSSRIAGRMFCAPPSTPKLHIRCRPHGSSASSEISTTSTTTRGTTSTGGVLCAIHARGNSSPSSLIGGCCSIPCRRVRWRN